MSVNLIDLVILRHGEAAAAHPDRDRALTEYGKQQVSGQYQWLLEQGFKPELILHSPYRRTTETASLSSTCFPEAVLQEEPLITPGGDPTMVTSLIPALGKQQILLASHMPIVAHLTAVFLPEMPVFHYPVAGLCWLQIAEDGSSAKLLHKHWPDA